MLKSQFEEIVYSDGVYQPDKTLVLLQREAAFIDPGKVSYERVGTMELESCVALIISDEFSRTFFAHVDEITELNSHFDQVKQFFLQSKELTICSIGANCDTVNNQLSNQKSKGTFVCTTTMDDIKFTVNATISLNKVTAFIQRLSKVLNITRQQMDIPKFQASEGYYGRRLLEKEFIYELKTKQFYRLESSTIILSNLPNALLRDLRSWMGYRYASLQIICNTSIQGFHSAPIILDRMILERMVLLLNSVALQSESNMILGIIYKFAQYLSTHFDQYNSQIFMDEILFHLSNHSVKYIFSEKSSGFIFIEALKSLSIEPGCYNKVHGLVSKYKADDQQTPTNTAFEKGQELRKFIYKTMRDYNSRKQEFVEIKESNKSKVLLL